MRVYPVNVLLEGKKCVVVGGGEVASRKVMGLLEAGAIVTVVSPEVCDLIGKYAAEGRIAWISKPWSAEYAREAAVMIVATDDDEANRRAAADARAAKVPVNVADMPKECDFILPSVFRRGPITVAVGTGGTSPALAAYLRRQIQDIVGLEYALAADILGKLRKILEEAGVEPPKRGEVFKELIRSGLPDKLKDKDRSGAETLLIEVAGKYADVSGVLEESD